MTSGIDAPEQRPGFAPTTLPACPSNPHSKRHQLCPAERRHDRNGRPYLVRRCQLCGCALYARCEEQP